MLGLRMKGDEILGHLEWGVLEEQGHYNDTLH